MQRIQELHLSDALKLRCYGCLPLLAPDLRSCICPMHSNRVTTFIGMYSVRASRLHLFDALKLRCYAACTRQAITLTRLHLFDALKLRCYQCYDREANPTYLTVASVRCT